MDEIRSVLAKLNKVNIADLERKGKICSFSDVQDVIIAIFEKIKILQNNPDFWELLSKDEREEIQNHLENFLHNIKVIQSFNPVVSANPQHERDTIADRIRGCYSQFNTGLFSRLQLYALDKKMSHEKLEELAKQTEEALSTIQQRKKQIDEILTASLKTSAITGVSKFAGVFGEQAEQNKKTAGKWLWASIISAVVIGVFLWQIFDQLTNVIKDNDDGANFQISLQIFLTKILFLSFFSVIFFQVVKNYNANMHLFTLNKHRENSMRSFQSFVQSTEDPKIRDAVLIQATKAIFEAGESGYVTSKEGTITGMETIKIVDQIKGKSSD